MVGNPIIVKNDNLNKIFGFQKQGMFLSLII